MFGLSYYNSSLDTPAMQYFNIAYDESLDTFLGTRSYNTLINCSHNGYLYSVGLENSMTFTADDLNRRKYIVMIVVLQPLILFIIQQQIIQV